MKERSIGSWEDKRKDIMSEPEVDEFPENPQGEMGREGGRGREQNVTSSSFSEKYR